MDHTRCIHTRGFSILPKKIPVKLNSKIFSCNATFYEAHTQGSVQVPRIMKGVYFAQSLNSHLLNSRLSSQNKSLSKCLRDWITTSRTWISKHNSSSLICVIRCPNLKKIFIRNILKTVANNCVINNGESPDFLNFLRNCLTIFFNILDIGSASPQSYTFLFT